MSDVLRGWTNNNNVQLLDLEKMMLNFKGHSNDELHFDDIGSKVVIDILGGRMG